MCAGRKCRACRYIGQPHPNIHILKRALMLTATIKSVLSAQAVALWPGRLEEREEWWRLLEAIKLGGGNCRGQSHSRVETPLVLKQVPPSLNPELTLCCLLLLLSAIPLTLISGISTLSVLVGLSICNTADLDNNNRSRCGSLSALVVFAGCNSNSMWKLRPVPVEVLLPAEDHPTQHQASALPERAKKLVGSFSVCRCSRRAMGHKAMTY